MSERALECNQETIRVKPLGDPFDVAPPEAREAAPIAALETQVRKEVCFLYACRGERTWIDVQAVPHIVLSPLQSRNHSFHIAAVRLRDHFNLQRRMRVSTVH